MLLLISVVYLALAGATTTSPDSCEKAPPHAQPTDGKFLLSVAGDPDLFLPGELYTVSLQGVDSGSGPTPFIGFTIWAEIESADAKEKESTASLISLIPGAFQAYDAQAKQHELCTPAVNNATAHPKSEIQVIWSAPLKAVNTCVRLCARASPADGPGAWSVLAKKLCAAPAAPASFTRQPPIVEPCCACDEAKYEVTFEGMWSRHTHPRDFPPDAAQAHFSDVIGASHTAQYRVWQEGRVASMGLRRLADDGTTTALEKELKAESDHIRTIIKARGISWQQIVGGGGIPSTFAVFRVDAKHHLVSLAAKLAPSPDWIVGVSALELCNLNCTWRTSITLPLYPYDAGTDAGLTYTSRRQPTIPASPVRALRPDWPRDVRSPFYSTSGEMRPFARLRINRLRLYEKSCDANEPSVDVVKEPGSSGACATHVWGPWSQCSVTCGEGRAVRQRHYIWPARAYSEACRVSLTDFKRCFGPRRHCRAATDYESDPAESTGPCAVSEWSEWSPCEGCGVRARTRHYLAPRAHKRCHVGFRASTVMSQAMPCEVGPCEKPPGINSTSFDWFYVDMPRGECAVTAWGGWSPCSAKCGRGKRLRTRMFLSKDARLQKELARRLLRDWNLRFAELQQMELPAENITAEEPELEAKVQEHLDKCQQTLTQQEALCDGEDTTCFNNSNPQANASSEGSRASEAGEAATPRGSTLPRAATSPAPKFSPEASPSSSITSEGVPYPTQAGSNNMSEAAFSLKPILSELRERREDYERLAEKMEALKKLSDEVSFLSAALQEERFKTERLEEQINDLTELHQNEVENLKQALTDVEEKVQYQSEERIRDIHEALDLCQTKISKLEQWMAGSGGGAGGAGAGGEAAAGALPPRLLLVKLLNVALTLLQLALLLVATAAGIAMPFLRTRVRVLTTSVAVMMGVIVLKQWPEVMQLSEHLIRRFKEYLLDKHHDRYECKSLCG